MTGGLACWTLDDSNYRDAGDLVNTQRWHPHASGYVGAGRRLQVGDVIGFDHAAWRVEHVQDAVATGEEKSSLEGASAPIRWPDVGPYNFTVRRLHGPPAPAPGPLGTRPGRRCSATSPGTRHQARSRRASLAPVGTPRLGVS